MEKELQKLTTKQLIEFVETIEHYPAVTIKNGKDYIVSYLVDEACTISRKDVAVYLLKKGAVITNHNIPLYYEFMSKKDISRYRNDLHYFFNTRLPLNINDFLEIDKEVIIENWKYDCFSDGKVKKQSYFGIKDTLKPIDKYIADIKNSNAYKSYIAKNYK